MKSENDMNHNAETVDMVIVPRLADLGNFEVQRVLPFKGKRMIGPFIFWDQMGPGSFLQGQGIDVRPHPHIGLSTVTYLFHGSLDHKDSLGNNARIVPGDVNLMTAGSGIVHSERTGMDVRQKPSSLFGIQSWLAQPKNAEEGAPDFEHVDAKNLPDFAFEGIRGRVILGQFDGLESPVSLQWESLYAELFLEREAKIPISKNTEERAIYIVSGAVEIDGIAFTAHRMIVLKEGMDVLIKAIAPSHLMLLGGATMDSERYIYWNFVSSNKERLEQAKDDWRKQRFAKIPGDDHEFIPLPE